MTPEQSTALITIARKIEELLIVEQDGSSASRWKRGLLYKEARGLFPSNQEFGTWCNRTNGNDDSSCDVARMDDTATINRLMRCVEFLDEDQFYNLKYSRAVEVVPRWLWEVNQGDVITNEFTYGMSADKINAFNTDLIKQIHAEKWSVKQCRQYMKELKEQRQKAFNEQRENEQEINTPPDEIDLIASKDEEIDQWKKNNIDISTENEKLKQRIKEYEDMITSKDKLIANLKNTISQLRKVEGRRKRKQPNNATREVTQLQPGEETPF